MHLPFLAVVICVIQLANCNYYQDKDGNERPCFKCPKGTAPIPTCGLVGSFDEIKNICKNCSENKYKHDNSYHQCSTCRGPCDLKSEITQQECTQIQPRYCKCRTDYFTYHGKCVHCCKECFPQNDEDYKSQCSNWIGKCKQCIIIPSLSPTNNTKKLSKHQKENQYIISTALTPVQLGLLCGFGILFIGIIYLIYGRKKGYSWKQIFQCKIWCTCPLVKATLSSVGNNGEIEAGVISYTQVPSTSAEDDNTEESNGLILNESTGTVRFINNLTSNIWGNSEQGHSDTVTTTEITDKITHYHTHNTHNTIILNPDIMKLDYKNTGIYKKRNLQFSDEQNSEMLKDLLIFVNPLCTICSREFPDGLRIFDSATPGLSVYTVMEMLYSNAPIPGDILTSAFLTFVLLVPDHQITQIKCLESDFYKYVTAKLPLFSLRSFAAWMQWEKRGDVEKYLHKLYHSPPTNHRTNSPSAVSNVRTTYEAPHTQLVPNDNDIARINNNNGRKPVVLDPDPPTDITISKGFEVQAQNG